MTNEKDTVNHSRRRFIKKSGLVVGGTLLGTFIGTSVQGNNQQSPPPPTNEKKNYNRALKFFTRREDFDTLSAATERIFPEDENGPGAIQLGVPYFIDHELASGYGHNDREYMKGPFFLGSEFQGYQSPLKRRDLFLKGLRKIEEVSKNDYNASFVDLEDEQQDELLTKFEEDKVEIKGVKASFFFNTLISATFSGAYADPLYGGNADMEGWNMKEFPGAQMSYLNEIEEEKFIKKGPIALNDHM
ncbi:gluconate 2-dehydrogenase subunit 3 family protein [Priestia filamentosa]|uniref:gluconate 2-dehydrogenase subunit 3 family protein n=1 Tax=Priestia filamentosa TaxID=1402861 RepID=UPI0002FCA230|nr:gluconate 2-dehydrogenase subunit 3 family protein [Priestia filamentosa]